MAPPKSASASKDSEDLKHRLESLSETLVKCWDGTATAEHYAFLRRWCTADYYMDWHGDYDLRETHSLEEHLKQVEELKLLNPAWKMNAYNFTAMLDRNGQAAMVMFTSGPSGSPGNPGEYSMNRESVSKLMWREREVGGDWECFGHVVLRGGGLVVPMVE